jgi:molybdopterin-guanine dinucleotide biosynthesis protein A
MVASEGKAVQAGDAGSAGIARASITGLVLAGGRGSRMGGVDKGLEPLAGKPLVQHAIERLAPQVAGVMINANRNLDAYLAFGLPVCADDDGSFAGPLAGMLAGLRHCATPWLVSVPCDTPRFPVDLVQRLAAAAAAADAEVAMPLTRGEDGQLQPEPVFCLLRTDLAAPLEQFLAAGGRKIDRFTAGRREVRVPFEDAGAFFNINSAQELNQAAVR